MNNITAATQDHLDIEDIREDLVILKGGAVACVLQTSAINFDLLSEEEQDTMIGVYSSILNSFSSMVQIVIRSKRTDISDYIAKLRNLQSRQENKHLGARIGEYVEFVGNLVSKREVLNKRFYIVIRYGEPAAQSPASFVDRLLGRTPRAPVINKDSLLKNAKLQLGPRREQLIDQLRKIGVETRQLTTQELVELFYEIYNPATAYEERLRLEVDEYTAPIVEPAVE